MNTSHLRPPPLVSVVMAVFGPDPRYFREAVRSILDQTFRDLELIIVEDPSPLSGQDMIADIDDGRISYHLNSQRTSLVEQRNLALAHARGQFAAVMDSDDVAEPERLQKQVDYLQAHTEVAVLGCQIAVIDDCGLVRGQRLFPLEHELIMGAMPRVIPISHPALMFRKSSVAAVGGYQYSVDNTVEDYDLFSRLAINHARFANLPDVLLRYRWHPSQAKAKRLRATIRGVLRVKERYWRSRMNLRARLRMWAERVLLFLPCWIVLLLLLRMHYRDGKPHKGFLRLLKAPLSIGLPDPVRKIDQAV